MDVAIYDLDKTLVKRATFTPFLAFAARRLSPWRLALLPVWILMMVGYRIGFYDRTTLKTAGMRLMLGRVPVERLTLVGADFAARHLARAGWIDEVIALVERDRNSGRVVAIATAAFEFYAKAFAKELGIDHVIATQWDGRSIPGGNCYGEAKLARVSAWRQEQGTVGPMRFVSDSFADAPLLEAAEEPVFVTHSSRKAERARLRGWAVIVPR